MIIRTSSIPSGLLALSLSACGASTASAPPPPGPGSAASTGAGAVSENAAPACEALGKLCHGHDAHSPKARACHEMGHAAVSNAECEAKKPECMTACEAK